MRYLICSAKQSRANQFSLSRLINIQQVGRSAAPIATCTAALLSACARYGSFAAILCIKKRISRRQIPS